MSKAIWTHGAVRLLTGLAAPLLLGGAVWAQPAPSACGSLENGNNGPFDYTTERGKKLAVVEEFHFTPVVESLIRGQSGSVGQDLDYTLTVYPNHHRALMALMRLSEKARTPQPAGARFPVECYFERALRFRSTDNVSRMIYATFLGKNGRTADAVKQLELADKTAGDSPFTHNNIGLIYFDMKDYDKALQQAHKAIALGFVQTTLQDQLKQVGKWSDPPAEAAAATASAPATGGPATGGATEPSGPVSEGASPKANSN